MKSIQAATMEKLIQELPSEDKLDKDFVQEFLTVYRSILTPMELLELLILRYNLSQPAGLTGPALHEWKVTKRAPIQRRYLFPSLFYPFFATPVANSLFI